MKISVDCACSDKLFKVSEIQKKVICNDIPAEIIDEDMKRRLEWVLRHKYERCFERLQKEWLPKLAANGVKSVPMDRDALAELIFAQPDYKDRSAREAEAKAKLVK